MAAGTQTTEPSNGVRIISAGRRRALRRRVQQWASQALAPEACYSWDFNPDSAMSKDMRGPTARRLHPPPQRGVIHLPHCKGACAFKAEEGLLYGHCRGLYLVLGILIEGGGPVGKVTCVFAAALAVFFFSFGDALADGMAVKRQVRKTVRHDFVVRPACSDPYSCRSLYGAYGPYGGYAYWTRFTYGGWYR